MTTATATEADLRRLVLEHSRAEGRQRYPATLCIDDRRFEIPRGLRWDHAMRVEVVQALARPASRARPCPLLWLTRPFEDDEDDVAWAAAAAWAGAEVGVDLRLIAVSKRSWCDPLSGAGRTWQRPIRSR